MRASLFRLSKSRRGAVAPTVAMSLFALVGMGGIAFDYAHLADLDTELQQAADQAALAAATQLDGSDGSRTRATAAAQALLDNTTFFASDAGADAGNARKVTIATVSFYQSYDEATDVYGDPSTSDSNARVVRVAVGGRRQVGTLHDELDLAPVPRPLLVLSLPPPFSSSSSSFRFLHFLFHRRTAP